MRFLRHIPLLVGLTLSGCGEEPSFRVRWKIDASLATHDTKKSGIDADTYACAEHGLLTIRTVTRDAFGVVVDNRTRPCSDAEAPEGIAGPTLPDGPYTVEVRGVRRDGVDWTRTLTALEELEPNPGCVAALDVEPSKQAPVCGLQDLACDCAFIEVAEGRTILLDDILIDAPPQCRDGVDNDNDGLVDAFDPACRVSTDLYAREDTVVVANAQLAIRTSFLDRNPAATCSPLGISRLRVNVDDEPPVTTPLCSEVINRVFQVAAMVTPSTTHTVNVVGVDSSGQERTVVKSFTIDVPPAGGGRFEINVDFAATDFLEPLVHSATLHPQFLPYDGAGFTQDCTEFPRGLMDVPLLRMRVLGTHGQPLPSPVKLDDGLPLDGDATVACDFSLETQPLDWGEYLVELEGLSEEGEVCFSNVGAPALLAPGRVSFAAPRVEPPPPSCRDCEANSDCGEVNSVCDEGICRATCFVDADCRGTSRCRQGLCIE